MSESVSFPNSINCTLANSELSHKKRKIDSTKIGIQKVAIKVAYAFGKIGKPINSREIYAKFVKFSRKGTREHINKVINACERLLIESKLNPKIINKYANLLGYQLTWSHRQIIMLREIGPPSVHIKKK